MITAGIIQHENSPVQTYWGQQPMVFNYVGDLMALYQKIFLEERLNKLLIREIETVNEVIEKYVEDREKNSYLLFTVDNYQEAQDKIKIIKTNTDFLISALSFVSKKLKDKKIKNLIEDSMEVLQNFAIKLMEYSSIYKDLESYEGEVNEESDAYKYKMEEIVEFITSANNTKTANSISELLAL